MLYFEGVYSSYFSGIILWFVDCEIDYSSLELCLWSLHGFYNSNSKVKIFAIQKLHIKSVCLYIFLVSRPRDCKVSRDGEW
jgi:hypothetical protein